jgi:hypothetical protein
LTTNVPPDRTSVEPAFVPSAVVDEACTIPAAIVVAPVYVLVAVENVRVPVPVFVSEFAPEFDTTPVTVAVSLPLTSIVTFPDKTIGSAIEYDPIFSVELVTVVEAALAPSALVFATSSVPAFTAVVPL